jgi:hypothetical protein
MQSHSNRTKGHWAFGLASLGVLWTAAMIPGAFFFPAYSGESSSSNGGTVHTTDTLVGVNGTSVVWPLLVPLALSVVAWIGLRASCTTGSRRGKTIGNAAALLLFAAAILGFSLGFLELPAALIVVVAAYLTPQAAHAI